MDMLLRHVTMTELADIFGRHREASPAPYLTDPEAIERARELAKRNGTWDDLSQHLDPTQSIPVIKRSAYRNYRRHGDRSLSQSKCGQRSRELSRAALALWLDHPKADLDYLQDLLWAYCDDSTWVMAAHEGRAIDLGSAGLAATLAEILHVLGDRIEEEVEQRVSAEIEKRIFQPFWNYKHLDFWKTVRMNWNHVCNGEIIRTALYQIEDPTVLAHMTHAAIQNLTYALDGFTDDGGCEEGPGYWNYGFGHYLYVAYALYLKTGGELDLMRAGDKIERICRYPLAANIKENLQSTFADASHGHIPARITLIINEFFDIPELYELCRQHEDHTLRVGNTHELAMYQGERATGTPDSLDYLLPDLGQVKLRGKPGNDQITLMALAGNNGVPHNHNDIGSFILHQHDHLYLLDPGGPTYTRKTFSSRRYEILFCNSLGHSVPLINGVQQSPGSQYHGRLDVQNLNGEGPKTARIDMTHAYLEGTVQSLVRTFTLDPEAQSITLEDVYRFDSLPQSLEEAFITFEEQVEVAGDGQSVRIGPPEDALTLRALGTPGRFQFQRLEEASKEGRGDQVVTRITFLPADLDQQMCLRFVMGACAQ